MLPPPAAAAAWRRYYRCSPERGFGVLAAVVEPAAARLRVAEPARASARCIMEQTPSLCSDGYCTVPWCGRCTGSNPYGIAEFLLACNLCGRPLACRPSYMYKEEMAFCRTECRYNFVMLKRRKAKEKMRVASPPETKRRVAMRNGGVGCSKMRSNIFFVCPELDLTT